MSSAMTAVRLSKFTTGRSLFAVITLAGCIASLPGVAFAQSAAPVSREVVQATPSQQVSRLNDALRRLARNSRDVSALIDAGNAALGVGDLDAALGFFGRAQELSPSNASAKMGMAAVLVRSDRPIEALRLFAEAERAGASASHVQAERGLAYDLVGNNAEAQESYRAVLRTGADAESTRRLALSQAISGNREGFEKTLLPLLENRDLAAYRARAFGLAILGEVDEANKITRAVMPADLASRITPYLAYMPRLTKAQQAAAANLGIFPRAAEIGRDDPQIARYANSSAQSASRAGSKLAPQGEPLGTTRVERGNRSTVTIRQPAASTARTASSTPMQNLPSSSSTRRSPVAISTEAKLASSSPTTGELPPVKSDSTPAGGELPAIETSQTGQGTATRLAAVTREQVPSQSAAVVQQVPTQTPPQSQTQSVAPRPSVSTFDLANADVGSTSQTVRNTASVQPSVPEPGPERPSVADAFAGLSGLGARTAPEPKSGAVDITAIEVPREVPPEPKAEPKPQPPKHPSRHWVQVATGSDRSALRFDWRRFARKAPDLLGDYKPHVVKWGQANRLLAGPVKSAKEAREMVTALKEQGVDSFTYTSPEGQEINQLQ